MVLMVHEETAAANFPDETVRNLLEQRRRSDTFINQCRIDCDIQQRLNSMISPAHQFNNYIICYPQEFEKIAPLQDAGWDTRLTNDELQNLWMKSPLSKPAVTHTQGTHSGLNARNSRADFTCLDFFFLCHICGKCCKGCGEALELCCQND